MTENFAFTTGTENRRQQSEYTFSKKDRHSNVRQSQEVDEEYQPQQSAYTYTKNDRKLNAPQEDLENDLQQNNQQKSRQNVRQNALNENDGNKLPPPDDNDLLQLERKISSTNSTKTDTDPLDYDEYFDYLEKDLGKIIFIHPNRPVVLNLSGLADSLNESEFFRNFLEVRISQMKVPR